MFNGCHCTKNVYKHTNVRGCVCFNSGKIILYLQYKNKGHLKNTYIRMHLHFTVIHEFWR